MSDVVSELPPNMRSQIENQLEIFRHKAELPDAPENLAEEFKAIVQGPITKIIENFVQVRLDASDVAADGKRVRISSGMTVSAEIITGNRRVIEYAFSLLRYWREAG